MTPNQITTFGFLARSLVTLVAVLWIIALMISSYVTRTTGMITIPMDLPVVDDKPRQNMWASEFTDDDEHCLALNIYFEARGEEGVRGKFAVADVVMYRWMHANYPDTICDVVQDGHYHEWKPDLPIRHKCQFSWFCDGKSDKPLNLDSFEEAIDIAQEVLHDPDYEPRVEYSLFYHATWVSPRWARHMEFVETIGNHSFYR